MVWTVLTGILDMATLENTWPPTWKMPIGNVLRKIDRVGLLIFVYGITGLAKRTQYPATNPNWTIVSVTGSRN